MSSISSIVVSSAPCTLEDVLPSIAQQAVLLIKRISAVAMTCLRQVCFAVVRYIRAAILSLKACFPAPTNECFPAPSSAFEKACIHGRIEDVKALLQDQRIDEHCLTGDTTPLSRACYSGHIEVVRALLQNPRVDVNAQDNDGETPLKVACLKGQTEVVRKACFPAPTNECFPAPSSAFEKACIHGRIEDVKALLQDQRIDVNCLTDDTTPLSRACYSGHIEVVRALLQNPRVDVNAQNNYGETPLKVACLNGQTEVVRALLQDPRVDVNRVDKFNSSPLFAAICRGQSVVVRELLKARVDVNQQSDGLTPLSQACHNKNLAVVKMLLQDSRVKVNEPIITWCKSLLNGMYLLRRVCEIGWDAGVRAVLASSRVDINLRDLSVERTPTSTLRLLIMASAKFAPVRDWLRDNWAEIPQDFSEENAQLMSDFQSTLAGNEEASRRMLLLCKRQN